MGDVLTGLSSTREAVVTPLLLADAYHARIDIPGQIARSGAARSGIDVRQANALGEDDRLVSVLRDRLAGLGVSPFDDALGVLVVAIGSSDTAANARMAAVAAKLAAGSRWMATTAFATRPEPSVAKAPVSYAVAALGGSSSRRGSWRPDDSPTGCGRTRETPASRSRRRWAYTGWWPRRCWSVSIKQ
jgi:sirohydrochlorin ferrochelatase